MRFKLKSARFDRDVAMSGYFGIFIIANPEGFLL
jgi:hypothetical protein